MLAVMLSWRGKEDQQGLVQWMPLCLTLQRCSRIVSRVLGVGRSLFTAEFVKIDLLR